MYQEISPAILSAFGRDTEGCSWTINFLLDKCLSNLTRLNTDKDVLEDTVSLILSFADSKVSNFINSFLKKEYGGITMHLFQNQKTNNSGLGPICHFLINSRSLILVIKGILKYAERITLNDS